MTQTLPPDLQSDFNGGAEWLRYHLLNHAEISFRRILRKAPGHVPSRHLWGVALFKLGSRQQGVEQLRAAAVANPNNLSVWHDLAAALLASGDLSGAQAAYERATGARDRIPDDFVFSHERGQFPFTLVDYQYNSNVRYGEGKPSHPELTALLEAGRDRYSALINEMGEIAEDFTSVPMGGTYDLPGPFWLNGWFPPLDGMALTQFLRRGNPARFMEIGSGVSTKFARRAVELYGLRTRLTSIDPQPRNQIDAICDHVIRAPLEDSDLSVVEALEPGDILFLDSSHRSFQGSDVTVFFMEILPRVKPGVIVHIHDIYLPDDYISGHLSRQWNEQYLLATALLFGGDRFEVLFPSWFAHQDPALSEQAKGLLRPGKMETLNLYGASFWLTKTR